MMIFTIEETSNSPVTAVRNLIATLAEKRKDVALEPILQFAYGKLNTLTSAQDTLDVARQRESALRIIGCISSQLVEEESPVRDRSFGGSDLTILSGFYVQLDLKIKKTERKT